MTILVRPGHGCQLPDMVVSLVVAEQKRLASSLVGYMGFYELRAAMKPPPSVMMPSKVVGG
jgi:hypothetical protein